MKRLIKVTIHDFSKIEQHLNDAKEIELYHSANGKLYEAVIEHDDYAVIDLNDEEYIELAPNEYELMIPEWKVVGKTGDMIIETMSDPADDRALLYRGIDGVGNVVAEPQSINKQLIMQLYKGWFAKEKAKAE
ncbi:hypothetical protein EDM56_19630 [Brevibacillus fluminis]|uniref:Uncharacterized protein n=1 Tax=Brevibacillus fluminis TaxID=511487 RepID=A0A3M8DBW5_9BACL|nr:hypothetical protein [Brevibacillus fluminis]RNB85121.1 hypothetical protein EDM56_19630 [Brevibacillus fluminis]